MEDKKPVLVGGAWAVSLIALAETILALGQASGWWNLTPEALGLWGTVLRIAIPLVVIAATTWWTASRTTSLALPTDEDGVRLKRTDNTPAKQESRKIDRTVLRN